MKILITGITGQDGSYLAELCIEKGHEVHGLVRRSSTLQRPRIDHLFSLNDLAGRQQLLLHYGDIIDSASLTHLIGKIEPEVVFNLAAQSHVGVSFEVPYETSLVTGLGALNVYEAVRIVNPQIKIYQAGSSEMYGGMLGRESLDESSHFFPKSPYAAAKVQAFHLGQIYRDSYGMSISNGILFNHESPRRGENFVSRKIAIAVARIRAGLQKDLKLGNLSASRDWGHARDYAEAIWLIANSNSQEDYVVATGKSYKVQDFAQTAFAMAGLEYQDFVVQDPNLLRPNEVEDLKGNPAKIARELGWNPSTDFHALVKEMVEFELAKYAN